MALLGIIIDFIKDMLTGETPLTIAYYDAAHVLSCFL